MRTLYSYGSQILVTSLSRSLSVAASSAAYSLMKLLIREKISSIRHSQNAAGRAVSWFGLFLFWWTKCKTLYVTGSTWNRYRRRISSNRFVNLYPCSCAWIISTPSTPSIVSTTNVLWSMTSIQNPHTPHLILRCNDPISISKQEEITSLRPSIPN